jgi:uncharacterized protein (DUF433 family)
MRERPTTKTSVIHADPDILSGTPVFTGTRVPATSLFDWLEAGATLEEFLDSFPCVTRHDRRNGRRGVGRGECAYASLVSPGWQRVCTHTLCSRTPRGYHDGALRVAIRWEPAGLYGPMPGSGIAGHTHRPTGHTDVRDIAGRDAERHHDT